MSITRELWISNLLEAASMIADQKTQEQRWLAPDRYAWERPEDLLNDLDAYNLDLFIDEFASQFTGDQLDAAAHWKKQVDDFCDATPDNLDPAQVLVDPRWESLRENARAFIAAFQDKWPPQ
jgi:hypothetical protein